MYAYPKQRKHRNPKNRAIASNLAKLSEQTSANNDLPLDDAASAAFSMLHEFGVLGLSSIRRRIEQEDTNCLTGPELRLLRDLLRHAPRDASFDKLEREALDLLKVAVAHMKNRLLADADAQIRGVDMQVVSLIRRTHKQRLERLEVLAAQQQEKQQQQLKPQPYEHKKTNAAVAAPSPDRAAEEAARNEEKMDSCFRRNDRQEQVRSGDVSKAAACTQFEQDTGEKDAKPMQRDRSTAKDVSRADTALALAG